MSVSVGAATYWSEITQLQTLKELFEAQVIDPLTYIEAIPSKFLPNKEEHIVRSGDYRYSVAF